MGFVFGSFRICVFNRNLRYSTGLFSWEVRIVCEMASKEFPEFNFLTEARHGRMLYNKNDVYIGKSFELYGEFSYGETHLFEEVLKPGMTVIEVGANIGSHTVSIAQKVGRNGRVHAFEPQRIVFQTLCANIALNQATNVMTYYAAAGAEAGELFVPELDPNASNNFGGLGLGAFDSGQKVSVMTLDSLELPGCHFIKADVEGMEESVLRGADKTLKKFRPVLYVENDRQEKAAGLVKFIVSRGYRLFAHNPSLYNADNYKKNAENVFDNIVSKNLLCVHKTVNSNINLPEVILPEELQKEADEMAMAIS